MKNNKSLIRLVSAVVIAVMMATSLIPVGAAPDGYREDTSATSKVLVDLSDVLYILEASGVPSDEYARTGQYSTHWNNHTSNTSLKFTHIERDWSSYNKLSFDIYSKKATGSKVGLIFYTDLNPAPGKTTSYFKYDFYLNFEGWQTFDINPANLTAQNEPDWSKMQYVQFTVNGWDFTAKPDSDVYINSIIGTRDATAEVLPTEPELTNVPAKTEKEIIGLLKGNTAMMPFANYAIINGKKVPVNKADRITTDESGNIAPFGFYKNVLGAKLTEDGKKVTISYGGANADVSDAVVEYDGIKYITVEKVMEKLGKECNVNERIIFIGNKENNQAFVESKAKTLYLQAILFNKSMFERTITKDDWEYARDKWKKFLVSDENIDLSNPDVAKKVKSIDAAAKSARSKMNKGTTIRSLFSDKEVTVTNDMYTHYARIQEMATAYGTYGSAYYKDPTLLEDIVFALDWCRDNIYGMAEFNGTGWRRTDEFNWWDWYIGAPTMLSEIILILDDDITQAQAESWMEVQRNIYKTMRLKDSYAPSRIHIGTLSALIHEDLEWMQNLVVDYNRLFFGGNEEGGSVREDWLYITHDYYAYSTMYGMAALLDRMVELLTILDDTAFEMASPFAYNTMQWMEHTFAPVLFNGFATSTQMGRDPGRETYENAFALAGGTEIYGVFGKDDDIKLKQILSRNFNEKSKASALSKLNIDLYMKLMNILEDEVEVEPYNRSKTYYTGDSLMHQRDDWGVALQMSSTRIAGWESINGQNLEGWYQGDGRLLTYTKNDPYCYDLNWHEYANQHLIPGTTADDQIRTPASIRSSRTVLSKHDFAGMAHMDELYSTAAMQLETHNYLQHGDNVTTISPGGDTPYHKSSTMAKKAWFMFDDEVVALGTDVNEKDGHEVRTILDNKRMSKSELKITQAASGDGVAYDVVSVTASESQEGNGCEQMIDNDVTTRWSAEGNQWAVFELKEAVPIGYLGISWYYTTLPGKVSLFDLETSMDGQNWTQIYTGQNTGTTKAMEAFDMKGTVAKYVRYNGHGRGTHGTGWNSVTEVKIYAPTADGSMPVEGAVNENRIYGSEIITVDGTALEKVSEFKQNFTNSKWFHIEDYAGYYLPEGGELVMNKVMNETFNFLEVWLTHGKSPKNGSYAYVLMPTKTAEETKAYAENPDIKILTNTPELQVVEETKLGVKGMVFWKEGTFEDITTTVPGIIMTQKTDAEYKVNISDPTQKLNEATITVEGKWKVKEADSRCTVESAGNDTIIKINFVNSKGRTLPVTLIAQ